MCIFTALLQPTQVIDLENINGDCTNGGKTVSILIIATDKGIPNKSSNTTVDITIQVWMLFFYYTSTKKYS